MNFFRSAVPFMVAALVTLGAQALRAGDPDPSLIENTGSRSWHVRISDLAAPVGEVKFYSPDDSFFENPKGDLKSMNDFYKLGPKQSVMVVVCGSAKAKGFPVALHLSLDLVDNSGTVKSPDIIKLHFLHGVFNGMIFTGQAFIDKCNALGVPVPVQASTILNQPAVAIDKTNPKVTVDVTQYLKASSGAFVTIKD